MKMPMIIGWFDLEPVSFSHWGMIMLPAVPRMIVPADLKIDPVDLDHPGHIVWVHRERH